MMTTKNYIAIAEGIAQIPVMELRVALCESLGNRFTSENPKFDWHKWRVACNAYGVTLAKVVTTKPLRPILIATPTPISTTPPTLTTKPMSDVKLGTIIEGDASKDAIHVCLAPCVAAHYLCPGDHVGILEDGKAGGSPNPVGIVDPFLKEGVQQGQKFWVCIYPGTIKGLRHEWEHPAFKVEPKLPEPEPEQDDDWCGTTGCS